MRKSSEKSRGGSTSRSQLNRLPDAQNASVKFDTFTLVPKGPDHPGGRGEGEADVAGRPIGSCGRTSWEDDNMVRGNAVAWSDGRMMSQEDRIIRAAETCGGLPLFKDAPIDPRTVLARPEDDR
jgi:hypothetical protein